MGRRKQDLVSKHEGKYWHVPKFGLKPVAGVFVAWFLLTKQYWAVARWLSGFP